MGNFQTANGADEAVGCFEFFWLRFNSLKLHGNLSFSYVCNSIF